MIKLMYIPCGMWLQAARVRLVLKRTEYKCRLLAGITFKFQIIFAAILTKIVTQRFMRGRCYGGPNYPS